MPPSEGAAQEDRRSLLFPRSHSSSSPPSRILATQFSCNSQRSDPLRAVRKRCIVATDRDNRARSTTDRRRIAHTLLLQGARGRGLRSCSRALASPRDASRRRRRRDGLALVAQQARDGADPLPEAPPPPLHGASPPLPPEPQPARLLPPRLPSPSLSSSSLPSSLPRASPVVLLHLPRAPRLDELLPHGEGQGGGDGVEGEGAEGAGGEEGGGGGGAEEEL